MKKQKILLYSGGLDSYLIDKLWKPDKKLYVNMHTRYSEEELTRLPEDVSVAELSLGHLEREDAIIPLRNLFLYAMAAIEGDAEEVEICLGATQGDRIFDKTIKFIELFEPVLNYLFSAQTGTANEADGAKKIKLVMWAKEYSKADLIKMYLDEGGNVDELVENTFTCYTPNGNTPCWNCKACFRNACMLLHYGWIPADEVLNSIQQYIEEKVLTNPLVILNRGGETEVELSVLRSLGYDEFVDSIVKPEEPVFVETEKSVTNKYVKAYVDGSNEQDKIVGSGVVVLTEDAQVLYQGYMGNKDSEYIKIRNVGGEILSATKAMQWALDNEVFHITIYHDYKGLAEWCEGRWKAKSPKAIEYVEFYKKVCEKVEVDFVHVRGHRGNFYNEQADWLAGKAVQNIRMGGTEWEWITVS